MDCFSSVISCKKNQSKQKWWWYDDDDDDADDDNGTVITFQTATHLGYDHSNLSLSEQCKRRLEFKEVLTGQRLMNHMICKVDIVDHEFCGVLCFMEHNCVSYNLMTTNENGKHKCELNNATHEDHKEDLKKNSNYVYHGAKVRASQKSNFNF